MTSPNGLPEPPDWFRCPLPWCGWELRPDGLPDVMPDREIARFWISIARVVAEHLDSHPEYEDPEQLDRDALQTIARYEAEFGRPSMFGPSLPASPRHPLTANGAFGPDELERMLRELFRPQWNGPIGHIDQPSPMPPRRLRVADERDILPRRRNVNIGCRQVDGTWIHGRPHDCPRFARGR